ncbi:enoyl-CoA hydratase [Azospirillum sp. TSH58]|uniref:enoyl-CoA hydratase n=1 Tax=Azospirillum sp. TSH58 TaxID=664962 RepID=UPI000D5FF760|nr:enoyl-CoA hydratase [Azospirillum sp. TSH58]AWJ82990.1 enoyl-CoA hydratase [Azospirillum sp. TSH58]PWC69917.1 enoyl-CoA hydratase [Azospirillum sp. TSH58]
MNDTPPAAGPLASDHAPLVLRQDRDGVATLTLNRPQARNALSVGLMGALQAELDAIHQDSTVRVVVLAGAGPAFCAGHDLKEMRANPDRAAYESLFVQCSRLMLTVSRIRQPVIAKVHGIATAAGCQLVATCDLAYCADTARFATPGVNIGLFCSTPMVALSRAVGRKAAMEMLLLGDLIGAEEAERIGLVNHAVPADRLDAVVAEAAGKIAAKSPLTLAIGKEAFYRQIELDVEEAYAYAARVMTENMLARDAEEGIDAFLQKRAPVWCGQ